MTKLDKIVEALYDLGIQNNVDRSDPLIAQIEKNDKRVYHVFKQHIGLGNEIVLMTHYLVVFKTEGPKKVLSNIMANGQVYAYVINHDWDIEEYGTIGIKIRPDNVVVRVW
jgi:hypothetical protein